MLRAGCSRAGFPSWVIPYLRGIPGVRWEKVDLLRGRIASGAWDPASVAVAEGLLFEHLFASPTPAGISPAAFPGPADEVP